MRKKNIIGEKYGKLTVIDVVYNHKVNPTSRPRTFAYCKCECGNIVFRDASSLNKNKNHSCGCDHRENVISYQTKDVVGQKFGKLTILCMHLDKKPITVTCKCDCGNIVELNKSYVVNGHTKSCGCLQPQATSQARKKDWSNKESLTGVKYIRNTNTKDNYGRYIWECLCPFCGNHFETIPGLVESGKISSCGCINFSRGELIINNLLTKIGVSFKRQYTFDDLRGRLNSRLRFDFALFDGDKLKCLIEYDGEQHFKEKSAVYFRESLEERQYYDALKNDYCAKNNINLIRIPYYKKDEEIKEIILNICNP